VIALPQNRSQTPAVRPTQISDDRVNLFVSNFRRYPIHARLPIERFAQSRRREPILRTRSQYRQSARIKIIECSLQLDDIRNFQPPAVSKIRLSLQRPVISCVVMAGNPNCILASLESFQGTGALIVPVTKDEAAIIYSLNTNLAN
jgi:hypothetical protein